MVKQALCNVHSAVGVRLFCCQKQHAVREALHSLKREKVALTGTSYTCCLAYCHENNLGLGGLRRLLLALRKQRRPGKRSRTATLAGTRQMIRNTSIRSLSAHTLTKAGKGQVWMPHNEISRERGSFRGTAQQLHTQSACPFHSRAPNRLKSSKSSSWFKGCTGAMKAN